MRSKLVIGTYEINHQYDSLKDYLECTKHQSIHWIDTAITYDNDYFLKDCSKKLISKISPFMTNSYEFWVTNHLKSLNRDYIDIMLVHNTRHESWLELYGKILTDERFKSVGISNANIDELEQIKSQYGSYPEWIEMEINPYYYNESLINFCKSNEIKIIAYAIFGGKYNARKYIQQFTLPYLLHSVLDICDKVIIRWDSDDQFYDIMDALEAKSEVGHWSPIDLEKSIVPDVYGFPKFIKLDPDGFPVYFNESNVSEITHNYFVGRGFHRMDNLGLEFITEYQAYLRYNSQEPRVAITDHIDMLSKVANKDSKIYIKYEIRN